MKTPNICITKHNSGDWYVIMKNNAATGYCVYSIATGEPCNDVYNFSELMHDNFKHTTDISDVLRRVVKDK